MGGARGRGVQWVVTWYGPAQRAQRRANFDLYVHFGQILTVNFQVVKSCGEIIVVKSGQIYPPNKSPTTRLCWRPYLATDVGTLYMYA